MCLPKSVGGLNLINITLWNKAAIAKLCWDLAHKTDKLWIRWIHSYYIKTQQLLNAAIPQQASWVIRQIISARATLGQVQLLGTQSPATIQNLYFLLIGSRPRVIWKCMIFSNGARPKAIFALSMQMHNKLCTTDRLAKWGMNVDVICKLLHKQLESRDHLYLHCEYTSQLWKRLMIWIQRPYLTFSAWESPLEFLVRSSKGKTQDAQIFKLVYTEFVHAVWIERNQRVFENTYRHWDVIAKEVAYLCNVRAPIGCDNWCGHWKQCVWFIPKKGLSLLKDEEVNLLAAHTDTSFSYEMKNLSQNMELGRSELSTQTYQITLPPEKFALYSDVSWRCSMLKAIKNAIDLIVAEPFYYCNNIVLPWKNLRFWKEISLLDSILSEGMVIMPCKGLLKACAMSLPDLWRSHRCLQDIEGFDHSVVNSTLGACGGLPPGQENPILPFSRQCGESKKMSYIVAIMEFNFLGPISPCSRNAKLQFIAHGKCHGFVLWIDWVMDTEDSIVLSTNKDTGSKV